MHTYLWPLMHHRAKVSFFFDSLKPSELKENHTFSGARQYTGGMMYFNTFLTGPNPMTEM